MVDQKEECDDDGMIDDGADGDLAGGVRGSGKKKVVIKEEEAEE